MKDLILTGFLTFFALSAFPTSLIAAPTTEISSIAIEAMRYSDQIRLNFNNSIETEYAIDKDTGACLLSLFNVPYTSAVASGLARNIKNASKNISNVLLSKITDANSQEGTQLKIIFANNNIHLNVQTLEHPHQLIIDVVSNNLLQTKLHGTGVIAQAFNGVMHAHYAAHTLV